MDPQKATPHDLVCSIQDSVNKVQENMGVIEALGTINQENMLTIEAMQNDNRENIQCIESLQRDTESEMSDVRDKLDDIKKILEQDTQFSLGHLFPPSAFDQSGRISASVATGKSNESTEARIAVDDTETPEANAAIEHTNHPLTPANLKKFLNEVYKLKHPHVIAKKYTTRLPNLISQLREVQRYLLDRPPPHPDTRLEKRIDTLIMNLLRDIMRQDRFERRTAGNMYAGPPRVEANPLLLPTSLSPANSSPNQTSRKRPYDEVTPKKETTD